MAGKATARLNIKPVWWLAIPLALTACGSFPLAGGVTPPAGKTGDGVVLDAFICREQAASESRTFSKQAGSFALGFFIPIAGIAIDYEMQKQDQRKIFKACMEGRGYAIKPVAPPT